jgi:hypothetical protein
MFLNLLCGDVCFIAWGVANSVNGLTMANYMHHHECYDVHPRRYPRVPPWIMTHIHIYIYIYIYTYTSSVIYGTLGSHLGV